MARKKKGNSVNVDFTDVAGNALLPEESGYRFKILSATQKDNDGDGSIAVKIEVLEGPKKTIGKTAVVYFNLGASSLWVLRNFLDALGVEVPEGPMDIDLDELTDMEFIADNTHNTYNDRTNNRLGNFLPADGESASKDEDEDEDEVKVTKKKKRGDEEEEDEDDEEEAPRKKKSRKVEDDEDEDEEEKPRKKKSRKDEDEDEDEEEDEAPKKKKRAKDDEEEDEDLISEDEVRGMDIKELKSLVKKHGLDVDLADYPTLRKQAMAVVSALEEAELLQPED